MDRTERREEKRVEYGGEGIKRNKLLTNKKEDLTASNVGNLTKLKEEPGMLRWGKPNEDICQGRVISS